MSDFLTHLIDRAAGQAPLLQRRPRALFEPAGPGGAAVLEEQREEVAANVPPAARLRHDELETPAAGERRSGPAATIATRAAASAVQPPTPPREPKAVMPAKVERVAPPPSLQVPIRETVLRTERMATVVETRPPAFPDATDEASAPKGRRFAKSTAEAAAEPPPARARRQVDGNVDALRAPAPRAAERRYPPPSAPAARSQRQAAAAVLIAKAQAGPKAPLPAAVTPPAPVQISIGRVEVRAHSAAEPRPRPAAAAAPKLKLDDYLRQRSGGTS